MRTLILVLCLAPALALAAQVGTTKTFTAGETLTATDLNGNFAAHETAINDNNQKANDNTTAQSVHAADPAAHHTRYTDAEAVGAIKAADGAGSGLDADTLDGKTSADFTSSNQACTGGNVVTGVDVSGTIICALDSDTVYTDADAVAAVESVHGAVGGGLEANTLDGMDSTDFVPNVIAGKQPRLIRQINVQTDSTTRQFGTGWALGATFTEIPDFKAGSLVRINYRFPMRNDSTTWGGGYVEPQISFDGGTTWESLGSSGFDGGVMSSGGSMIGVYSNTIILDPAKATDFSVTLRFYHKAYDNLLVVNGNHDINGISGTAALMSGDNGLQHFTRVIVEELY